MYAVLRSRRGTYSTWSQNQTEYVDMIRSGNYTEVHTGTKLECDAYIKRMTK